MARCKCCQTRGFMIETDVNGLCSSCAPYYYLTLPDDLKELDKAIRALEHINNPEAAAGRIAMAEDILQRMQPYVDAGLVNPPMPWPELMRWLYEQKERWENEA